jgi:lysophospholipase L1-like esterase
MKYVYILVLPIVIVAIVYIVMGEDKITNYPSNGSDIIAYGDSLVYGVGSTKGNDFVSVLSKKISRPIINLGVSGNTTLDGVKRLSELDKYNPKVVILLLGGNDYLRKVPRAETISNLQTIINSIHARGSIVLLLGVRGGLLVDNFKEDFEQLSKANKTAFVPNVLDNLIGNEELMSDQIHPNDAGYLIIAERVYRELKDII